MQRLLVLRRVSSVPTGGIAGLARDARSTAVLTVATVLVAAVYALWGYLYYTESRDRSALSAELRQRTQERRDLAAAAPDLAALERRETAVRAVQNIQAGQLFGSVQSVAAIEAVSGLAERLGVTVQSLTASEPQPIAVGEVRGDAASSGISKRTAAGQTPSPFESITYSLNVRADRQRILQFAEALQSGAAPGMALRQISVEGVAQSQAMLTLEMYTWTSKPVDAPLPFPLPPEE